MTLNKKIKMIVLDLDGTLVDHGGKEPSDRLIHTVKQANAMGIEIVIATGRHKNTSHEIAKRLSVDYIVTLNGGEIWSTSGELIHRQALSMVDFEKIVQQIDVYNSHYWLVSDKGIYQRDVPEDYTTHQWIKFGFDIKDDHIRKEAIHFFEKIKTLEIASSSTTNIELNCAGTHKRQAIETLLETREFGLDAVMAIGDSMNDLKLIEACGMGVAMGNASERVKEKADLITDDFIADGAALVIERLMAGELD